MGVRGFPSNVGASPYAELFDPVGVIGLDRYHEDKKRTNYGSGSGLDTNNPRPSLKWPGIPLLVSQTRGGSQCRQHS